MICGFNQYYLVCFCLFVYLWDYFLSQNWQIPKPWQIIVLPFRKCLSHFYSLLVDSIMTDNENTKSFCSFKLADPCGVATNVNKPSSPTKQFITELDSNKKGNNDIAHNPKPLSTKTPHTLKCCNQHNQNWYSKIATPIFNAGKSNSHKSQRWIFWNYCGSLSWYTSTILQSC